MESSFDSIYASARRTKKCCVFVCKPNDSKRQSKNEKKKTRPPLLRSTSLQVVHRLCSMQQTPFLGGRHDCIYETCARTSSRHALHAGLCTADPYKSSWRLPNEPKDDVHSFCSRPFCSHRNASDVRNAVSWVKNGKMPMDVREVNMCVS